MTSPAGAPTPAGSLSELFELHADRVFGYAFKRCADRALAEDLTAVAFEAASRRFAAGAGHEVTLPWLFTVVQRRLIDHWRSESRRTDRMARLRIEVLVASDSEVLYHSDVTAALGSLAANQRAALVLRYLDDLSVSEVAEELGLTYKATESLLSRSRRAFSVAYWEQR